jgi:hypothetical protein
MIYLLIFISKILENTIATLRLIVVANGKKKLGAVLQGLVSFVWIIVTGIVIIDVNKDIFKIITFVLGSTVGSYLGSIIEEFIALGNNLIIIDTKNKDIGIISPYNAQVSAVKSSVPKDIDVTTVHKFQGREKDVIIITTVDNEISDFVDDPYLLNVAISRAKKKLYLVVSGNDQPNSNISDLISYIEYNNFSVTESKIFSIFDYLYQQYTESRKEFLKKRKRKFPKRTRPLPMPVTAPN